MFSTADLSRIAQWPEKSLRLSLERGFYAPRAGKQGGRYAFDDRDIADAVIARLLVSIGLGVEQGVEEARRIVDRDLGGHRASFVLGHAAVRAHGLFLEVIALDARGFQVGTRRDFPWDLPAGSRARLRFDFSSGPAFLLHLGDALAAAALEAEK